MPVTMHSNEPFIAREYSVRVGDAECIVRAATVWPIADILDLESQFEPGAEAPGSDHTAALVADVLDSRMIPPPRPRRRRERAVSSRAVFYAAVDD
jgi:hypothetical protein